MAYIKLQDKALERHSEPEKRRRIVRAKLRALVPGSVSQAQRLFIDTLVPIYLELDEMAKQYGSEDFDMQRYLALQAAFRSSFSQLSGTIGVRRKKQVNTSSNKPETKGFDLGDILGQQ